MSNNVAEFAGPALATALVLGAGAGWAFALDAATFLASAAFLTQIRPRRRGHLRASEPGRARELETGSGITAADQLGPGEEGTPGAWVASAEGDTPGAWVASAEGDTPGAWVAPSEGDTPGAWVAPGEEGAPGAWGVPSEDATPARQGIWEGIRAGSREVASRAWVWATLASFSLGLFFGLAPWFVLGPLVARQQYGHLSVYGIVEATLGFGTILGSFAGVLWRPRFPMRTGMLLILIWPVTSILYALGLTLALVLPATAVAGAGIALFEVWWLTALAERIPPASLSRVSSFDWMISFALLPLGYILAGPLADSLGAVGVLIGGSILAWLAFSLGLLSREVRTLERLSTGPSITHGEEPRRGLTHRS